MTLTFPKWKVDLFRAVDNAGRGEHWTYQEAPKMTHPAFKSPLDAEMVLHGHRYGILVHFVKEAVKHDMVKHMPREGPYLHNWNHKTDKPAFDESCIRCSLEESIKHVNRKGWDGLKWNGKAKS